MNSRHFTSRWFRVYDEALDDPKIKLLTDKQHRFWFECLCLASRNGGFLPPLSHISFSTRRSPEVAGRLLQELVERGLIESRSAAEAQPNGSRSAAEAQPNGSRYAVHNWAKRQYKSDASTERVNKMRSLRKNETVSSRHCNGDETACVTASETETDTETETETHTQPRARPIRLPKAADEPRPRPEVSGLFQPIWDRWPRQVGKDSAARDWVSVCRSEDDAAIMACVESYLGSDEVARGCVRNLGSTPDRTGWLIDCARDGWACRWPARASPEGPKKSRQQEAAEAWSRA